MHSVITSRAAARDLLLVTLLCTGVASAQTVAITGGKVYPVSGPPIENATVLVVNGRITAVGASVQVPANARRQHNR